MKIIKKICLSCSKEFDAPLKEHNRGNGKYCSKKCSNEHRSILMLKNPEPNVSCALCGKKFYKNISKQKLSKSKLYFCCREHKDQAQCIGGIQAIMPPHYGTAIAVDYRSVAFRELKHECAMCGYKKYPQVLEAHHIDHNRLNSSLQNLQLLCPTCHEEHHFLTKSGKWASKN